MRKVLTVLGPTCSGKSDLAVYLAKELDGEIVNADSMQVYRHFDIGSAKPDRSVRAEVAHHLIDVVEPYEEFNAALFKELADAAIRDIWSREKVAIVVGGTGLYLRVLFHGLFAIPKDPELRQRLRERYAADPAALYEELKRLDPEYAFKISHRDKVRVVRALEVYQLSGKQMSAWEKVHGFQESVYNVVKIGLRDERKKLYLRINDRVEAMLEQGWVKEVEHLLDAGYARECRPFSSIGYRQILLYLEGALSYPEMVESIKKETRHYAKRQETWFSREKGIEWFHHPEEKERVRERASQWLKQRT